MSSMSGSGLNATSQMRKILLLEGPWKIKNILCKLVFNSRMGREERTKVEHCMMREKSWRQYWS